MMGRVLNKNEFPMNLDWSRVQIVLVTGWKINTCGHVLLHVGGGLGHYFHFDGSMFDYPKYIKGDSEYRTYLTMNGKKELLRKSVDLPRKDAAQQRLCTLMHQKWLTLIVAHNCASFVQQVIEAGGNYWAFPQHCPVLGMSLTMYFDDVSRKMGVQTEQRERPRW